MNFKKQIIFSLALGLGFLMFAGYQTAQASGILTSTDVSLSTYVAGASSTATVTFTTSEFGGAGGTGIPVDGIIKVLFYNDNPSFVLTGVTSTAATCSSMNGNFTTTVPNGFSVWITRAGDGALVGTTTAVTCTIDGIVNPSQATSSTLFTIITTDSSSAGIDDADFVGGSIISAPTISTVTPSTGSTAGGTSITIAGTGFAAGAGVTIGGNPATHVTVVSGISITASTSAGTAGAKNVVVTNTDTGTVTKSNGFTYSTPALATITLSPLTATLTDLSTTQQLTATKLDQFSNPIAATLTWTSSNTNVATVSSSGLVTPIGVGTTNITASTSLITSTAPSVITVSLTSGNHRSGSSFIINVSLNETSRTLTVGNTDQLTTTIDPSSATNQNVIWSSSNSNVATVSASGLVTAVGPGTATITVTTTDGSDLSAKDILTVNSTSAIVSSSMPTAITTTAIPAVSKAVLSQSMISAIVSLLQSFGADATTVANVTASLNGMPTSGGTVTTPVSTSGYNFARDLTVGSTGADVTALQQILVGGGYLVMPSGVAYGNFGALTKAAVIKYQLAKGISPAAGYVGAKTRAVLNK